MPFRAPGHYLSPSLLPIFSFPVVTPWSIQYFQCSNPDIGHASLHTWDAGLDFFLDLRNIYDLLYDHVLVLHSDILDTYAHYYMTLDVARCTSCIHDCGWIYVDWHTDYLYHAAAMALAINFVSALCKRWRAREYLA